MIHALVRFILVGALAYIASTSCWANGKFNDSGIAVLGIALITIVVGVPWAAVLAAVGCRADTNLKLSYSLLAVVFASWGLIGYSGNRTGSDLGDAAGLIFGLFVFSCIAYTVCVGVVYGIKAMFQSDNNSPVPRDGD